MISKKKLFFGLSLLKNCIFKIKVPISVNFKITNRCNRSCRYCNYPINRNSKEMNTVQIISMINQFKKLGMRKLSISGGEPLLRSDLGEIISFSSNQNIITIITSNGDLEKNKIKELKGVDCLTLSLDGPKEIHNKLRGENSYENVIEAIEAAKIFGLTVHILTVLSKENIDKIEDILTLCERMKTFLSFQPVFFYSFSQNKDENSYTEASKLKECIGDIIKRKKSGTPILNTYAYLSGLLNWPVYPKRKCWAGYFFCSVDPSGRVYPCTKFFEFNSNSSDGNSVSFADAFNKLASCNCDGCWAACFNEYNNLFSLRLNSITNFSSNLYPNSKR